MVVGRIEELRGEQAESVGKARTDSAKIAFELARNTLLPALQPIVAHPLADEEWSQLLRWAQGERLVGLLAHAAMGGAFPITEEQRHELGTIEQAVARTVLLLERLLLATVHVLDRAGIDYRIIKGPALAHTVYNNPSIRHFGDIDVLVRAEDIEQAMAALASAAIRRTRPAVSPGFDRRFGKGATLFNQDKLSVDLHRTLASGWFGLRVDRDDLFATSTTFTLAGTKLRTLDPETTFLGVCYNAVLGESWMRPRTALDIATLASRGLDLHRLYGLAKRWGGEAIVSRAVKETWKCLALRETDLSRWAAAYEPSARDRRALRTSKAGDSTAREAVIALKAIKGLRDKTAYIRALLFPNRALMHRIGPRGYLGWWARGVRRALRKRERYGDR